MEPWSGGGGAGVGTADDIREQHHQIMDEQDKGLEQLSHGLRKQQRMGYAMQDEIQEHNGVWVWCACMHM